MLIFDIETDGFLETVTTIHCLVIHDTEEKQTLAYTDQGQTEPVVRGIQRLEDSECVAGHNVIHFDLPVIRKLYPWFNPVGSVLDTLLLSRLIHPNLMEVDKKRKWPRMPLQLYGRHSLEAYGHRLGEYKGEFGKTADWSEYSQEMEQYCAQDVKVTTKLCNHFAKHLSGYN